MKPQESVADFKARIAAIKRGKTASNGDYVAPQLDAATIMRDVLEGVVRPAHEARGPRP